MHLTRLHSRVLLLIAFSTNSLAAELDNSGRCLVSISEALTYLSFTSSSDSNDGGSPSSFLEKSCTNRLRVYSLYAAAKVYCTTSEIEDGHNILNNECATEGFGLPTFHQIDPDLTEEYINALRIVDFHEVSKGVELEEPVLISRDYFWRSFRTNEAWAFEIWAHRASGYTSYFFWGFIMLCGISANIISHLCSYGSKPREDSQENHLWGSSSSRQLGAPFKSIYHWIKTYISVPLVGKPYHRFLVYSDPVPTRFELIVTVLFYFLSIILTSVGYDVFKGNLFWDDTFTQIWRYLSDRTGIMSYANLPLLWLFGGRNNIFLWATGWSFSTFNLFHRAIAIVATVQAIIHSIGYTVLTLHTSTYTFYWPSPWWYMGVVGTILMSLLLWFSGTWMRRKYYETFLFIHIASSIVILIALFIHTSIFSGEYDYYLWPVVCIWCIDRSARLVKLVLCNFHLRKGNNIRTTKSVAHYNTVSDIVRLDVTVELFHPFPKPGEYYYIYQPLKWRGYESHPFTLASWTAIDDQSNDQIKGLTPNDDMTHTHTRLPAEGTDTMGDNRTKLLGEDGTTSLHKCKLTFWIRPFSGWTRRLRSECLKSPTRTINTNFIIEGPYGTATRLWDYDNVILIAGGTGIAAALPFINDHISRTASQAHQRTGASESLTSRNTPSSRPFPVLNEDHLRQRITRTQTITLVWSVRQAEFIHDLASQELAPALGRDDIKTQFYCTYQKSDFPSCLSPQTADENTSLISPFDYNWHSGQQPAPITIQSGRPPISNIMGRLLTSQREGVKHKGSWKTAVLVCGPGSMAQETRQAVHHELKQGHEGLDYFEEAFGW